MQLFFSLRIDTVYFNDDTSLPIYGSGKTTPSPTKEIVQLIIGETWPDNVCTATPVYVDRSVEFFVDTSKLIDWKDIRTDMVGGLTRSGTKSFYYEYLDCKTVCDVVIVGTKESHDLEVKRYTYIHKSHPDFHKVIIAVWKKGCKMPFPLFYVQYYFEDAEHPINFFHSHGNSKRPDDVRKFTNFSVKQQIKTLSQKGMKGKALFNKISKSVGGFEHARTSAEIPSSYTQIYDISRKFKNKSKTDETLELIDMCNNQRRNLSTV